MGLYDDEITALNQRVTDLLDPSPAPAAPTGADSDCGCDGNPIKSTEDTTKQVGAEQADAIVADAFDVEMTDHESQSANKPPPPDADCPPIEERTLPVEIELVRRINTLRKRVYDSQKELCSADAALLMMYSVTRSYIPYFAMGRYQDSHMIDHIQQNILKKNEPFLVRRIYDSRDASMFTGRFDPEDGLVIEQVVVDSYSTGKFLWELDEYGYTWRVDKVVSRCILYRAALFANAPLSDVEIDGLIDLDINDKDYGPALDAYIQRYLSEYPIRPYVIMLRNIALLHETALRDLSKDAHKTALALLSDSGNKEENIGNTRKSRCDLDYKEQLLSSGYIRHLSNNGHDCLSFTIDIENYSISYKEILELVHLHAPTNEEMFSVLCLLYGRHIVREFQRYIQKTEFAEFNGCEVAIFSPDEPLTGIGMDLGLSLHKISLIRDTYMPQCFTRVYN